MTYDDGSEVARGIFGQGICSDPKRQLVIVTNANWAACARDPKAAEARETVTGCFGNLSAFMVHLPP